MIQANGLVKWYGPHLAVDGVDIQAAKGQVVGFLGPNGAGKTTTIRILTGYLPPSAGVAWVNGYHVIDQPMEARRSVGYLPEANPLYPELRVDEHLHMFGALHDMDRQTRRRRIDELTERCGLTHIRRRVVGQLSKGNRQRVGLAQALLHDPPVLILDEPTAGLDPAQVTETRKLINELARGGQKTILLSTHILPEVEKTCDQVLIIARGRIAARGTPQELRSQSRGGASLRMEIGAEPHAVEAAMRNLPQLKSVTTQAMPPIGGPWTLTIVTPREPEADLRVQMGQLAAQQRWVVRELRSQAPSLEELFIQIVSPPEAPDAKAAEMTLA